MPIRRSARATDARRLGAAFGAALVIGGLATEVVASRLAEQSLHFRVLRGGDPIGRHKIERWTVDGDTVVEISIDLKVKVLFLTVFAYEHRNREVWRDGQLVSLDSRTDDDGEKHWLKASRTGEGVRVIGSGGTFTAPFDVMTTSYWNDDTVNRSQLLDTQNGKLIDVTVAPLPETEGDGWRGYQITGDLDLKIWYDSNDELARIAFDARGASVDYERLNAAATRAAGDDANAG